MGMGTGGDVGGGSGGATSGGGAGPGAGGSKGQGAASGQGGVSGSSSGCPAYQQSCNGVCTSTSANASNCGACGATCPSGQVCSGTGCAKTCEVGLSACSGACVDKNTDNANCGSCGHVCGAGQGCIDGSCGKAKIYTPPAHMCDGGGPPITVNVGMTSKCTGAIAQTTFPWGVCSCKNALLDSHALIDGFDSMKGPYKPGQAGGGLGANGSINSQSGADIWGRAWAASHTGITFEGGTVHQDLFSGGSFTGEVKVGGDAYIVGSIDGSVNVAGKTTHPASVKDPCACDNLLPVADIVTDHAKNNDNASIGLDPTVLSTAGHPARIDLPCGNYYLKGFTLNGATAIVVHGRTAIYIDGNINAQSNLSITLDVNSELDVFVSGTITSGSDFSLGSANYPALTRLYIGGSTTLELSSTTVIAGNIYAPNAKIVWTSTTDMYGSIFAGDFDVQAELNLHHDESILHAGDSCTPPPPPPGNTGGATGAGGRSGAGGAGAGGTGGTPMCGTCQDCLNQACINGKCGECGTDADCCPPLTCRAGTCEPVSIR